MLKLLVQNFSSILRIAQRASKPRSPSTWCDAFLWCFLSSDYSWPLIFHSPIAKHPRHWGLGSWAATEYEFNKILTDHYKPISAKITTEWAALSGLSPSLMNIPFFCVTFFSLQHLRRLCVTTLCFLVIPRFLFSKQCSVYLSRFLCFKRSL